MPLVLLKILTHFPYICPFQKMSSISLLHVISPLLYVPWLQLKILFRKFSQNVNAGHKSAAHCWIIEEHPMKQAFGVCPTHEQRAAYLSLCSGNALVKLCLTFVFFGFLSASITLQPKLLSCLLNAFSAPFSLPLFSLSLSNLLVTVRSQPSGTWSVIGVSAVTAYSTVPNDALGRLPRENSISSSHLSVVIIRIFPPQ